MRSLLAGLMLCALALPLGADDDDWRRGRDRERGNGQWRPFGNSRANVSIVNRTMSDLRSAAARNRVDSHEREHFRQAMYHLDRFQYSLSRDGRFDTGHLDDAIDNLRDLARADQIHPRDRQMLARDLAGLREFRSMRGGSGWY
jgi:hypothetical protein